MNETRPEAAAQTRWRLWPAWPSDDLLRDRVYRRLWLSILISSVGGQVTMLALPLTAALMLHATPTQMGLLTAIETLPFVLLSLPAGVWLDRVRKLPVYIAGELALAVAVLSVPLSWWQGWLAMPWLYAVAFVIGAVQTVAGSAAQIVLMQVVPRGRLVEAHAKNALANSGAEIAGPAAAGVLIRLVGAPLALLVDAVMLVSSAAILRGIRVVELRARAARTGFRTELMGGLRFVRSQRLLVALAASVGMWQLCNHAVQVVQILHATRTLGLSEQAIGLCFTGLGLGAVVASAIGHRVSARLGPGPAVVVGFGICATGWLLPAVSPAGALGVAAYALMLVFGGVGGVLMYINFLALSQAVTPEPLLGRMTTTMRWLILLPAGPGALAGGWIGEHLGLRATLGAAALLGFAVVGLAWRVAVIREQRSLPEPETEDRDWGAEAAPGPAR